MTDNDCLSSRQVCCWSVLSMKTTTEPSLIATSQRWPKWKTSELWEHSTYKNHHRGKSYRQPLTAEQTQDEGVVGDFYILDSPHNHALSAIANGWTDSKQGSYGCILHTRSNAQGGCQRCKNSDKNMQDILPNWFIHNCKQWFWTIPPYLSMLVTSHETS